MPQNSTCPVRMFLAGQGSVCVRFFRRGLDPRCRNILQVLCQMKIDPKKVWQMDCEDFLKGLFASGAGQGAVMRISSAGQGQLF